MRHLAITGIGGFIGLRMTERALALGWRVSGVDLSPEAVARARALGADARVGDITDAGSLAPVFAGADLVFHTAAVVQEDGPRALYERVNNQGTETVCRAAREAGVTRLLHLSSIMAYGFDYPDQVGETGPFTTDDNLYNETKLSSERIALAFNAPENGFEVVVLRPGDVYGVGSVPWITRPLGIMAKRQFILPAGGRGVINHVHVDNLIDGVLLAADHPAAPGEAFNLTDGIATSCRDYFGLLAKVTGHGPVPVAPTWLLDGALRLGERVARPLGLSLPVQRAGLRFLTRRHAISIAKAQRMLGYQPRIPLHQGMRQLGRDLAAQHR